MTKIRPSRANAWFVLCLSLLVLALALALCVSVGHARTGDVAVEQRRRENLADGALTSSPGGARLDVCAQRAGDPVSGD
jgi:hypothetical protein